MNDVIPDGWTDFFVAVAGAAGALAGLIIVAMSVNIQTILSIPSMTSRAGATVASLVLIVVAAVACLIPDQGPLLAGVEVLLFTAGALTLAVKSGGEMITHLDPKYRTTTWVKSIVAVAQVLPFGIGGVILMTGNWSGLYWVAGGVLAVFVGSVANAWVLLVEILR